jgi:hypothetical protein
MNSLHKRLKDLEDIVGNESTIEGATLLDPETKAVTIRNRIRALAREMIHDDEALAQFVTAYGIPEECRVAFDATDAELLSIGIDPSDLVRELLASGVTSEFIREGYPGEIDRKPVQPYVQCSTPRFSSWESRHPGEQPSNQNGGIGCESTGNPP